MEKVWRRLPPVPTWPVHEVKSKKRCLRDFGLDELDWPAQGASLKLNRKPFGLIRLESVSQATWVSDITNALHKRRSCYSCKGLANSLFRDTLYLEHIPVQMTRPGCSLLASSVIRVQSAHMVEDQRFQSSIWQGWCDHLWPLLMNPFMLHGNGYTYIVLILWGCLRNLCGVCMFFSVGFLHLLLHKIEGSNTKAPLMKK